MSGRVIAGIDDNRDVVPLKVDSDGRVEVIDGSAAPATPPATETTQALVLAELQALSTQFDIPIGDLLTELQAINAGDASSTNQLAVISELQAILARLDIPLTQLETAINALASASTPGAATEAKQDDEITQLQNINTQLDIPLTQLETAINALASASTPGAATEAKQDDEITQLQNINTQLDIPLTQLETAILGLSPTESINQEIVISPAQVTAFNSGTPIDIGIPDSEKINLLVVQIQVSGVTGTTTLVTEGSASSTANIWTNIAENGGFMEVLTNGASSFVFRHLAYKRLRINWDNQNGATLDNIYISYGFTSDSGGVSGGSGSGGGTGGGDASQAYQLLEINELQTANSQLDIPLSQLETAINNISGGGGTGDATLAEQQLQTTELNTLNSDTASIDNRITIVNNNLIDIENKLNDIENRLSVVYSSTPLSISGIGETAEFDTTNYRNFTLQFRVFYGGTNEISFVVEGLVGGVHFVNLFPDNSDGTEKIFTYTGVGSSVSLKNQIFNFERLNISKLRIRIVDEIQNPTQPIIDRIYLAMSF